MNDQQLDRKLQSVGKEVFVKYFNDFKDADQPAQTIARRIAEDRGVLESAAKSWRVTSARAIISAGRGKDGLAICAQSEQLPHDIRTRAANLLKELD